MKTNTFQLRALELILACCFLTGGAALRAQSVYEPYAFTTLAGSAGLPGSVDAGGSLARFDQPWGVAVDGLGNVYVADTLNQTIRMIAPGGNVTTLAGVPGTAGFQDGSGASALFSRPTGVAPKADGSALYVADYNNHVIRKISLPGGVVSTLAGSAGTPGSTDGTGSAAQFRNPFGVAVDPAGTVVYVTDQNNQSIRRIDTASGAVTTLAGSPGIAGSMDGPNLAGALFNTPRGIAVDGGGNLYVADAGNFTVRKVLASGGVTTLAGLAGNIGFTDAMGSSARFSVLQAMSPFGGPCGVAVDAAGNVYVTDQGNDLVRAITPAGSVTTLAGLALTPGGTDGTGASARFNNSAGIAVDGAGMLYVADTLNHTIRTGTAALTNCISFTAAASKTVACGAAWDFDAPTNIVDACCNAFKVTSTTVTNGLCPLAATRTWLVLDTCGNSNTCSQTVTVAKADTGCAACATWTPQATNRVWNGVASSGDGSKLVAAAFGDQLYTSADFGVTWTARETNRGWWAVASSADGVKLVALVSHGQIYTSADSGASWTARETNRSWFSVASSADGTKLVAVADNDQIYTSADSGGTWTGHESARSWRSVSSSADGTRLMALAYGGQIYTSGDSGATWVPRNSGIQNWYSSASSADGTKLVAGAFGGAIYTSADSGVTWAAQNSGNASWYSISSSADGGKLFAAAFNGQLYCSMDSGVTWAAHDSVRNWSGIASSGDGSRLVAEEYGGGLIYTAGCVATAPPLAVCAADKTVACGTAWDFDAPEVATGCGGGAAVVTVLGTVTNGVCPQLITRTWSISDPCGDTNTCSQTVTVVNTNLPGILCPQNIVVASCTATPVFFKVTASDGCDANLAVLCTPPSGSLFASGTTTTVSCLATNCAGTASCSFTVTVECPAGTCSNLVVNGGFETTSPVVTAGNFNNGLDSATGVPGWTTDAGSFLEVWGNTVGGIPAAEGANQLEINAQSADETVTQIVTGLSTNCPATFCFDYTGRFGVVGGTPNNDFTVTVTSGGVSFSAVLDPAAYASGGWQSFCTNIVPGASAATIAFHGRPHYSDGTAVTQGGAHIDNVSLTQCCATNSCISFTTFPDKTVACGAAWDFDAPTNIVDACCTAFKVTSTTVTNGLCPLAATRTWLVLDTCGNSNTCSQTVTVAKADTGCAACATWTPQATNRVWNGVASSGDGSKLVAAAFGDQLYTSADFGVTWTGRETDRGWWAVASSADGVKLVALVSHGQVYTSADSGASWTARETNRSWFSVASSADGTKLVAVADNDQIYTSSDSGVTWTGHESNRSWRSVSSSADGTKLMALAYGGQIYTSGDSGATWVPQNSGIQNWYSSASSADGTKLVAGAFGGAIYISADSGVTWAAQNSGNASWYSIASSADGGKLFAAAFNGQLYCSMDSGVTWAAHDSVRNWSGIASSGDGSRLVAEEYGGGLIYTAGCVATAPPLAVCAADKTVACGTAWDFDAPAVARGCGGGAAVVTVLGTVTNGVCPQLITRTWSISDPCGNSNTCSQTVSVVNTNLPIIACPKNIVMASCTATQVFYKGTASDGCDPNLAVVCTPPSGSLFAPGTTTTVLCAATNCAGIASCSFTVTVECPTPACVPAPPNLVLWLPFDEAVGPVSTNLFAAGNNGLQVNGPAVVDGYVLRSLCFDGSSQSVQVPNYAAVNPGAKADFSLDVWVKRDPQSGDSPPRILIDKRDPQTIAGFSLAVSYGNLLFQMGDAPGNYTNYRDSGIVPADGQWHFVAVTISRGATNGGRFYLDGQATGTFDPTGHPGSLANTNDFVVGNTPVGGASPWFGCVDEVEMFSRALGADEIEAIFSAGAAGKCKPLPTTPVIHLGFQVTLVNTLVLTWDNPTDVLEKSSQILAPWVTVSNAVSPFETPLTGASQFFRLRREAPGSNMMDAQVLQPAKPGSTTR